MGTLCKDKISCQGWSERKRLAKLLAIKKVVGPILGFLKATDVGERKRAKKREKK